MNSIEYFNQSDYQNVFFLRVVCRLDSYLWPLCLTDLITSLAHWLKRPKGLGPATKMVRSLHPKNFCDNSPKQ